MVRADRFTLQMQTGGGGGGMINVDVFKGGRFTRSCTAFTPVWPAGSSWTACSSWRESAATERSGSPSSERCRPSSKVTDGSGYLQLFDMDAAGMT